MFLGSVLLGFIHLIGIGLEFAHCSHREFIFLPILQFCFVFLIMHFAFSQSRNGCKLGFSNIALSHLLVTQITLWLVHFDRNYGSCGYSYDQQQLLSMSSLTSMSLTMPTSASAVAFHSHETTNIQPHVILLRQENASSSSSQQPMAGMVPTAAITAVPAAAASSYPFSGILVPVIHHYQLLTITILSSIWLANNHADSFDSAFNLLNGFSNTDSEFGYQYFKKKASIKGFFVGLLMTSGTIVVLVLKDHQLSLITHTLLLVRGEFRSALAPPSHHPAHAFTLLLKPESNENWQHHCIQPLLSLNRDNNNTSTWKNLFFLLIFSVWPSSSSSSSPQPTPAAAILSFHPLPPPSHSSVRLLFSTGLSPRLTLLFHLLLLLGLFIRNLPFELLHTLSYWMRKRLAGSDGVLQLRKQTDCSCHCTQHQQTRCHVQDVWVRWSVGSVQLWLVVGGFFQGKNLSRVNERLKGKEEEKGRKDDVDESLKRRKWGKREGERKRRDVREQQIRFPSPHLGSRLDHFFFSLAASSFTFITALFLPHLPFPLLKQQLFSRSTPWLVSGERESESYSLIAGADSLYRRSLPTQLTSSSSRPPVFFFSPEWTSLVIIQQSEEQQPFFRLSLSFSSPPRGWNSLPVKRRCIKSHSFSQPPPAFVYSSAKIPYQTLTLSFDVIVPPLISAFSILACICRSAPAWEKRNISLSLSSLWFWSPTFQPLLLWYLNAIHCPVVQTFYCMNHILPVDPNYNDACMPS